MEGAAVVGGWVGCPMAPCPVLPAFNLNPTVLPRGWLGWRGSPEGHRWVPWQDQGLARTQQGLPDGTSA